MPQGSRQFVHVEFRHNEDDRVRIHFSVQFSPSTAARVRSTRCCTDFVGPFLLKQAVVGGTKAAELGDCAVFSGQDFALSCCGG